MERAFTSEEFLKGVDYKATEGDECLIAYFIGAIGKNLSPEKLEILKNDDNLKHAYGLKPAFQRYRINNFLNSQYSTLKKDISSERSQILGKEPLGMWKKVIEGYHTEKFSAYGLPVKYSSVESRHFSALRKAAMDYEETEVSGV